MEKFKMYAKRLLDYLIKTSNGMALGLFGSLIIGTIIKTLGGLLNIEQIIELGTTISSFSGVGIAVGVSYTLKLEPLWMISAVIAGAYGSTINSNPIMPYILVVLVSKIGTLILRKKTPVDILIIPLLSAALSYIIAFIFDYPIDFVMGGLQDIIRYGTEQVPFLMGIIVSSLMGIALTMPISSVAIAVALDLGSIPLAAGAAVVGCSCQMVGFAIQSIRDNNIGKVISVGIGTSMLQFKNILKKPIIWLPTIITSIIMGPIATCVVKLTCDTSGAGMGTCGLVGQLGTLNAMGADNYMTYIAIFLIEIIIPAILVFIFDFIMYKTNLIKKGDLEI